MTAQTFRERVLKALGWDDGTEEEILAEIRVSRVSLNALIESALRHARIACRISGTSMLESQRLAGRDEQGIEACQKLLARAKAHNPHAAEEERRTALIGSDPPTDGGSE